jgi:hypothetical protein
MSIFDAIYGFGGDLQRQFEAALDQARVPPGPGFDAKRAVLRQEAEARQRQAEAERLKAARAREQNQAIISSLDYSVPFAAPGSVEEAIARAQVDNRPSYLRDPSRVNQTSLSDQMRKREAEERKQPTINFADLDSSGIRAEEAARLAAENEASNDFMTPIPFAPSALGIADAEAGILETARQAQNQAKIEAGLDYGLQTGQVSSPAATSSPLPVPRPTGFNAPFKNVFVGPSANAGESVTSGGGRVTSGGGPAPSAQSVTPARVIVPRTRDEQLEAYENFGKNIPGTIDIGTQSFKIAGPSDIGRRATVPIPGTGATGAEGIASEVTRRLGLTPTAAAPAAAAPAQDGGGLFSNLLKGSVFDSKSPLTRQQRVMLGVAALKDAGNALEGKSTNFFGQTQQGFQQARESAAERQLKFLQQARIAGSEAATLLGSINKLTPPSQRAQIERQVTALRQMQENFLQQAGVPAPAAQDAPPSVGGMSEEDADLAQSQRRAVSLASGRIMGTVEQAGKDLEFLSEAALENPEKFLPLLEKAQKTVNTFEIAKAGARAEVAQANNEIRKIEDVIPDLPKGAGLMSLISFIPGTTAANVTAAVQSIAAAEGFSQLQKMREVSPTGGALGQVTELELRLLQDSFSAIQDTNQSPEQLRSNLLELLNRYKDVVKKAYQGEDGQYNEEAESVFGPPPDWLSEERLDEASPVVDEGTYLGESVVSVEDEQGG